MTVQCTSIETYNAAVKNLSTKRKEVFEVFDKPEQPYHSLTNLEISNLLGWPINAVTGRVKELREKGLLKSAGLKIHNGRRHMAWQVVRPQTLF